ncbi:ATP-binding cassette domain-containing protein [Brevibacillus ginsengisoli]|uniref:ATP-binding cassette domain-containing protein n=1 Tax=Brevibacillus ginsengisoli TaxID=363854 RepID=UPI003CF04D1D
MLNVAIQKALSHYTLDVTFTVADEIVVLFGPSGSGKSTILNSIAGITHPDSGFISLDDQFFYQSNKRPLPIQKRNIGYLFQEYALFPHMSVAQNIMYGAKAKGLSIDSPLIQQILEVIGIEHLLRSFPSQISGGEKQRVALARALAFQPDLLLLDEPFSALDQETRSQCHDILLRLHQQWSIPVLMVTHDANEAQKLGEKILRIQSGKLVTIEDCLTATSPGG